MRSNYYRKKYYDWQKKSGLYGAQQDLWMYEKFIKEKDRVLDFGCGGGYLLDKLKCREKYGVDINPYALNDAKNKGIIAFENLAKLPRNILFDVIISHHALEHVTSPFEVLKGLRKHLKKGGLLVCVVPADDWRNQKKFVENDINKHLFAWTPLSLSNLFVASGFKVKDVKIINRAWVPLSRLYYPYIPRKLYNLMSFLWSYLTLSRQIRIVARIK